MCRKSFKIRFGKGTIFTDARKYLQQIKPAGLGKNQRKALPVAINRAVSPLSFRQKDGKMVFTMTLAPIDKSATVLAQLQSSQGDVVGPTLALPISATPEQLSLLLNELLKNQDPLPYSFFVGSSEISRSLQSDIPDLEKIGIEETVKITFLPQAIFRCKPSTRCSATISGHTREILSVSFSPDGTKLATGSGDSTVRFWDITTQTAASCGSLHTGWVLCIKWSPDGRFLASGSMDRTVIVWDGETGKQVGRPLSGHSDFVGALAWEPYHRQTAAGSYRLASGSKDGTVRVWQVPSMACQFIVSSHTDAVTCVIWGGGGNIYSSSRDRTINIWNADTGALVRKLQGHGHWINAMSLSTDYVLRLGCFTEKEGVQLSQSEARVRFEKNRDQGGDRLVSGSDDFSMFLWNLGDPTIKPIRITGHQALVNQVAFSPDSRWIASGSFDRSVRVWNGTSGQFLFSLRGHVSSVYQIAWSPDSRYLLSGSKDSTLKIWNLRTKGMQSELPGHKDEVYAVDWAPIGDRVASGGKDSDLKIWCN